MATQPNRDSALIWHKSSASGGGGECVEVAQRKSSVLVRDSGDRSGPVLAFTSAAMARTHATYQERPAVRGNPGL